MIIDSVANLGLYEPVLPSIAGRYVYLYTIAEKMNAFVSDRSHSVLLIAEKGDARIACIAAASIVAKVTRDSMMVAYDE